MKNLFTLIFFLVCAVIVSAQSSTDSTIQRQIEDVEIVNDRTITATNIKLSRKQFLTMAGALEDPTRLLIKSPGISTANDQANSIIYHAMPSHYQQWSMYGSRVVNPNHLSNAGTISDFPARSAGGVNMLSGQVIGELALAGAPSDRALGTTAGISDITLRTPYRTGLTTNLSLIGLEAGYDLSRRNSSLALNYRYSTVGLLTGLGLDFGGEEINYQDLSGKYSRTTSTGTYDFYFSLGTNSNIKSAQDSTVVSEFKDRQRIEYNGLIGIVGIHHKHKIGTRSITTTLNASQRSEDREANAPFINLPADTILYDNQERLVSLYHAQVVRTDAWTWGAHLETWLHDVSSDRRFPLGNETSVVRKSLDRTSLFAIPRLSMSHRLSDHWTIDGSVGASVQLSDKNHVNPVGQATVRFSSSQVTANIDISRSAQGRSPELITDLFDDSPVIGSHMSISATYKGINLMAYIHHIDGIVFTDSIYGFNSLQNLDRLPITATTGTSHISSDLTNARIIGISTGYTKSWKSWRLSANLTLQSSSVALPTTQDGPAPLDYGHIGNITLAREWKISELKTIGFSASYHYRGGERQYPVLSDQSYEWGYTNYALSNEPMEQLSSYQRSDLRIYYKPSKRSTISLDIQNVTNRLNEAYQYYEPEARASALRLQLGLIPILSWRVDW